MLDAVRWNLEDESRRTVQMNDVDDDGYSALHYAARYNRLAVVELLVKAGTGPCVMCVCVMAVVVGFHCDVINYELAWRGVRRGVTTGRATTPPDTTA